MRYKRVLASSALIFLFALLWNSFVHGVVLREDETALQLFTRSAADRSIPLALVLTLGIAVMFMISHAWMVRPLSVAHSVAHGSFFGVLAGLLVDMSQYLIYPVPASLAAGWFIGGLIEFSLYGLIAAWCCPLASEGVPVWSRG